MINETVETVMPELEFDLDEIVSSEEIITEVETPVKEEKEEEPIKEVEQITQSESKEKEVIEEEVPEGADPTAYGVYNIMVERGHINPIDGFKGTYEDLDNLFEELPTLLFNQAFAALPEITQNLARFAYAKGEDVKPEDLIEFFNKVNPTNTNNIDLESEDSQRSYLLKHLTSVQGHDEESANELIEMWDSKEKLAEKAKFFFDKQTSKKSETASKLIKNAEQEKEEKKERVKEFKTSLLSAIDSTGWSAKRKKIIQNEIFTGELNKKSKEIHKYPEAMVQLADFMNYFDPKTGKFNLEAYQKQESSESVKQVKSTLEKHFSKSPFSTQSKKVDEKNKNESANYEFAI